MFKGSIIGNLGRDGELRYTPSGDPILGFSVASTRKRKGEESTTWVECFLFGKRASALAEYIIKGDKIGVCGDIFLEEWEARDGTMRQTLKCAVDDVELIGSREGGTRAPTQKSAQAAAQAPQNDFGDFDDDIPFAPLNRGSEYML